MALNSDATLEAFVNRIIRNKEIMEILKLPLIESSDDEDLIDEKRKVLIDKFVRKSAEIPNLLDSDYEDVEIDKVTYSDYGKIRITISFAGDIKLHHDLFGNPQLDILIYYDNTEIDNIYKLLDLISDEFSGQNLEVKLNNERTYIRNIRNEGIITQTAMINNYERLGIRFSFYANLYKINK